MCALVLFEQYKVPLCGTYVFYREKYFIFIKNWKGIRPARGKRRRQNTISTVVYVDDVVSVSRLKESREINDGPQLPV